MGEKFNHFPAQRNRERGWVNLFISNIPAFIEELPYAQLGLEPFLRSHAIQLVSLVAASSSVADGN